MKRALFVIAALILSGCSSPEPVAIKGEVISCGSVTSDKTITKVYPLSALMALQERLLNRYGAR